MSTAVGAAVRAETPATGRNSTSTADRATATALPTAIKEKAGIYYKGTPTTAGSPKPLEMEY